MTSDHEAFDSAADASGFPCALCNKSFGRRDLRNRHRRRCEKSFGKTRVSKKRSCDACGKSKLRCDLNQPSCSRCLTRQIPCQYPPDSRAAVHRASHDGLPASCVSDLMLSDDLSSAHAQFPFATPSPSTGSLPSFYPPLGVHGIASTASPFFAGTMDDLEGMTIDSEAMSRTDSDFWDSASVGLMAGEATSHPDAFLTAYQFPTSHPLPIRGSVHDSTLFSPPLVDDPPLTDPTLLLSPRQLPLQTPFTVAESMTNDSSSYPNSTFSLEAGATASSDSSMVESAGLYMKQHSRNRPSLHVTMPTAQASPMTIHSASPKSSQGKVSFEHLHDMGAHSLPTPSPSRPGSISALDQLHLTMQTSYQQLFSIEQAATILCTYPTEMLDKSYRSPYLHFKAHHSSEPGLPEPIAVALCCVSANTHRVESSAPFVCKMIDSQCERLIREFPKKQMDLDDSWTFLHALCIYQIESMLAMRKQQPRECIMSAELHHAFLLKMARSAARHNAVQLNLTDNQTMDWRSWTLVETLRRNIFLVSMINDVSFSTKALDGHYYEPIEDEYIANLPLPAPETVWKARTPQEWAAARDATNWDGTGLLTMGQALSKLRLGGDLAALEPLQKLVVSCAWNRLRA